MNWWKHVLSIIHNNDKWKDVMYNSSIVASVSDVMMKIINNQQRHESTAKRSGIDE